MRTDSLRNKPKGGKFVGQPWLGLDRGCKKMTKDKSSHCYCPTASATPTGGTVTTAASPTAGSALCSSFTHSSSRLTRAPSDTRD